jgi:hypothetical protein
LLSNELLFGHRVVCPSNSCPDNVGKPLNVIVSQPTTDSMDRMAEQLAKMVAPFKTTAWDGLHGSLVLVLDDADYAMVIKNIFILLAAPHQTDHN